MRMLTRILRGLLARPDTAAAALGDDSDNILLLLEKFPDLADLGQEQAPSLEALREPFADYTATVSSAGWAISLESAAAAHAICSLMKPARILDLGSGFTSFVFRRYAASASHPCRVCTVDDDPAWLGKTRDYLHRQGLDTSALHVWDDFRAQSEAPFDFVSHDMGTMKARGERLAEVLAYCAPGGLAFLDDIEKTEYAGVVEKTCAATGFQVALLKAHTIDRFRRYAGLAFRA